MEISGASTCYASVRVGLYVYIYIYRAGGAGSGARPGEDVSMSKASRGTPQRPWMCGMVFALGTPVRGVPVNSLCPYERIVSLLWCVHIYSILSKY